MDIKIRAIRIEDAEGINAHMYVAEEIENGESNIVGAISLHVSENSRLRH